MIFMDPAPLPLWLQLVEAAFTCMKDAKKSGGNRASHEKAKSRLPAVRKEGSGADGESDSAF